MVVYDEDIDFRSIDWKRFEELCFDFLISNHFHSLLWRQGGADSGRDIEAIFTNSNPIIGSYDEKWFVECKNHSKGLEVGDISTKIEWGIAEGIDHFLLITSTYLTQATRDWLNKRKLDLKFEIHVLEGKQYKIRLLSFPHLVNAYFLDDYLNLIKSAYKNWSLHGIFLEPEALHKLFQYLEVRRLSQSELAFLICNFMNREEEIENYCEDEDLELFDYSFLLKYIAQNDSKTVLKECEKNRLMRFEHWYGTQYSTIKSENINEFYCRLVLGDKFLEIYLMRNNKCIEARMLYRNS
ncbi:MULTISPECIES: restriction endonuclease [unclassified Sphingobacterium]|uniref:restriction endonuclease n=1 Tax=unclassified Sphingobacterium TaxID=2609468 RepID=UPI0025D6FF2C|nr:MULTISPECIES: restriction endonuclease [unclassified Sphingobacterium]